MRRLILGLSVVGACTVAWADPPLEVMNITQGEAIKFIPSPVTAGIAQAVLFGDPRVPGQMYVVRNHESGKPKQ